MRSKRGLGTLVRRGITLVELMVVITLLSVLMTLTVVYVVPLFQDRKSVQRGVDKVTTALLIGKQRSLRDQAPRGLRFVVENPLDPPAQHRCTQVVYLEQPDPYRTGTAWPGASGELVNFTLPKGSSLYGTAAKGNVAEYLVQPGDFFRLEVGTPTNYQIKSVLGPTGQNQQGQVLETIELFRPVNPAVPVAGTSNYRIIRQPRPIAGESPLDLPDQVVIDLGHINQLAAGNQVTTRTLPPSPPQFPNGQLAYEVLFDPAGGVMNRTSAVIVLWARVADASPGTVPPTGQVTGPADPSLHLLIAINPRSGFISTHPVADGADPLLFARDGRSSGM